MANIKQTRKQRWQDDHSGEPVLVFDNVSFGSGVRPVLRNVSFKLMGDETRILLGATGAGKSVLLKLADGLLRPDAGSIQVFGKEVGDMSEKDLLVLRTDVGMLFQESALFDSLCVRDNVAYELIEDHVPSEEVDQRVRQALKYVELEKSFGAFPPELSGGMQRRVAIARAIINDPDLLLYDSPTGGLDPVSAAAIEDLIIKQRDIHGCCSLLVTERLQDVSIISTHYFDSGVNRITKLPDHHEDKNTTFLFLHEGTIVLDGSISDLVHSHDPFIRAFLE